MTSKMKVSMRLFAIALFVLFATGIAGATGSTEVPLAQTSAQQAIADTDAELYELAKEEGSVVVYTASTGVTTQAMESFMAVYPGIDVELYSLGTQKQMLKIIEEQGAGIFNADVALIKESGGAVKHELVDSGMVERYFPADIAASTIRPYDEAMGFISFVIFKGLLYNTDTFEEPPVSNWWDLTTPEWEGRVLITDPQKGGPGLDFITAFAVNADEMAEAYRKRFGGEVELHGTQNAGYEFIRRLEANVVLYTKEDDIIEAVAGSDASRPLVAAGNSNDLQDAFDNDLPVTIGFDMAPRLSVINPAYVFLAKNAPHPNAARLFIRWMAGGDDGAGAGLDAFVQQGAWVTREGASEDNPIALNEVNLWQYDSDAFYSESPHVIRYWLSLQ